MYHTVSASQKNQLYLMHMMPEENYILQKPVDQSYHLPVWTMAFPNVQVDISHLAFPYKVVLLRLDLPESRYT
jgi:hypothetical protein